MREKMPFINNPWKKHVIICLTIVIISFILLYHDVIGLSLYLFLASVFFFSLVLIVIALIFYLVFVRIIKEIYKVATELNNHGYSQYGLLRNNLFVIIIISLYLIVFYTYFVALNENNLFKLLLAWLPVLIIRISHYADYATGFKIGKATADYIFPIWLIVLAYTINNLKEGFITILNKNLDVLYFFIAIVAVTYLLEIIMSISKK
jgi:hypothetical protein